jgi:hypothetical protein
MSLDYKFLDLFLSVMVSVTLALSIILLFRKRGGNVYYDDGQLQYKTGDSYCCLDNKYRNCNVNTGDLEKKVEKLEQITKIIKCTLDNEHSYTILCEISDNMFRFRCASCKNEKCFDKSNLSNTQKETITNQYPKIKL